AVADREHRQLRRLRGNEAAAVTRGLARRTVLEVADVGPQLERRLEPPRGRILVERVHAVGGDAAADQVEVRRSVAERGRAVGGVEKDLRMPRLQRPRPRRKARELGGEE